MGITYIISAVLLAILLIIFRGIYEYRHWDNNAKKYIYNEEDRLKLPLGIYIGIGILFFIPYINVIGHIIAIIYTILAVYDNGHYIHVPWLNWLGKKI